MAVKYAEYSRCHLHCPYCISPAVMLHLLLLHNGVPVVCFCRRPSGVAVRSGFCPASSATGIEIFHFGFPPSSTHYELLIV
eukprot:scaffold12832_cov50-Attheya_sp.AAC.2